MFSLEIPFPLPLHQGRPFFLRFTIFIVQQLSHCRLSVCPMPAIQIMSGFMLRHPSASSNTSDAVHQFRFGLKTQADKVG